MHIPISGVGENGTAPNFNSPLDRSKKCLEGEHFNLSMVNAEEDGSKDVVELHPHLVDHPDPKLIAASLSA